MMHSEKNKSVGSSQTSQYCIGMFGNATVKNNGFIVDLSQAFCKLCVVSFLSVGTHFGIGYHFKST